MAVSGTQKTRIGIGQAVGIAITIVAKTGQLAGPWNFTSLLVVAPGMITGKAVEHGFTTELIRDHGFITGLSVGKLEE